MNNEQQPTNRTINATQIEHAPCDFSDTTSNNSSSYASLTIHDYRYKTQTIYLQINFLMDLLFVKE
ncbi:hypothetical protein RhiirB3_460055 [Rhizophagus irregularis]|nr:hypothetical protein RhiirB3_460055 [Rhizophagus irregularis]